MPKTHAIRIEKTGGPEQMKWTEIHLPVPGKGALLLGVVACTAFPQITTVGPLFVALRALGLRDTWTALVLADASFALPLVLWLLAGFVREIPVDVGPDVGAHRCINGLSVHSFRRPETSAQDYRLRVQHIHKVGNCRAERLCRRSNDGAR